MAFARVCSALFCLFAAIPLAADAVTLPELLRSAKASSSRLKVAEADAEARAQELRRDAAPTDPVLTLNGGSFQSNGESGPSLGVSASQGLSLWGKRGRLVRLLDTERQAAPVRLQQAQAELVGDLLAGAVDTAAGLERLQQVGERRRRLEPLRQFVASQTFVSPQQKADRALVEARLAGLELEGIKAARDLSASAEALLSRAGLSATATSLDWALPQGPGAWGSAAVPDGDPASVPELKIASLEAEQADTQVQIAERANWPSPELSLGWNRESSGADEQTTLVGGLGFPLPLFQSNRAALAAATARQQGAHARLKTLQAEHDGQRRALETRLAGLREALERRDLRSLAKAVSEAERELKRGRLPMLSFLELENALAEAEGAALQDRAEALRTVVQLRALDGQSSLPTAWVVEGGR